MTESMLALHFFDTGFAFKIYYKETIGFYTIGKINVRKEFSSFMVITIIVYGVY